MRARIRVQERTGPRPYDIYLSHLQNNDVGGPGRSEGTTLAQVKVLNDFVESTSGPDVDAAFVMGDFNIDGLNPSSSTSMRRLIPSFVDMWLRCGPTRHPGITFDSMGDFQPEKPISPLRDRMLSTRSVGGKRLDYVFMWSRNAFEQRCRMNVVTRQFGLVPEGTGVDLSDHYGLVFEQRAIQFAPHNPVPH